MILKIRRSRSHKNTKVLSLLNLNEKTIFNFDNDYKLFYNFNFNLINDRYVEQLVKTFNKINSK